jgi:hypothetical protein
MIAATVAAGCPIPDSVHFHTTGRAVTVSCWTAADLDAWVAHLGARPVEVSEVDSARVPGTRVRFSRSMFATPDRFVVFLEHFLRIRVPRAEATDPTFDPHDATGGVE